MELPSIEEVSRRRASKGFRYSNFRGMGLELVAEDGPRSLWTDRIPATYMRYLHVVGMRMEPFSARSDEEALEIWRGIVDAERKAWGR